MFCILMLGAKLTRKEDAMICKSADSAGEWPAVPTLPNAITPGPWSTEESSSLTWTWLAPAGTGSRPLPSATPCPLLPCAPSTRFFADLTCLPPPCSHVCHTLLPSRPPGQGRLTPQSALVSEAPSAWGLGAGTGGCSSQRHFLQDSGSYLPALFSSRWTPHPGNSSAPRAPCCWRRAYV